MNAIVLAGGLGSRLAPWVAPKCLMPINGVSILQRLLKHLFSAGAVIARVVVCTGYRGQDVKAAVHELCWGTEKVCFSDSGEVAPMGQRLLDARPLTDGGRVIICYGDELADVDVRDLVARHAADHEHFRTAMTFCAAPQRIPGGTIDRQRGRLRIVENDHVPVNIGFVVVEPECWPSLQPDDGLSSWMNRISDERKLGMYLHHGKRATVNSLADLSYAEEVWR